MDLADTPTQERFEVAIPISAEIRADLQAGNGVIEEAESYVIDCAEMAQVVADRMNGFKRAAEAIDEKRKHLLEPAKQMVERVNDFFRPAVEGLRRAEGICKVKLAGWADKERARLAEEARQREEVARKARQEAEARAAAERAKAEEIAAQKRREAEEAERRRKEAEEAGNTRAAQAAAAAAAKALEAADAAIENGAAKATEAELVGTAVAAAQATISEPAKIAGFSQRRNFVARLNDGISEVQAKELIVKEAASRPELLAFLDLNWKALDRAAKTFEDNLNVPGFCAKNVPIGAGSRKTSP